MSSESGPPTTSHTSIRRAARALFALYTLALLTATHWPQDAGLPPVPANDKAQHVVAYFLWMSLLLLAFGDRSRRRLGVLLVIAFVLGALDEATQGLPGVNRSPDLMDWLADAAGAVLALVVWAAIWRLRAGRAGRAGSTVPKSDM